MKEFGQVILLQNIMFLGDEKTQIDSKFFKYRPCVVIGETADEIFVLPFSTKVDYLREFSFSLCEDDFEYFNKRLMKPVTYVKLKNIFKKDICYYEECGYINEKTYLKLLRVLKNRIDILKKNSNNGDIYHEYESILYRQIGELCQRVKMEEENTCKVLKRSRNET